MTSPDGVHIGVLSAGAGPALLVVHGGMGGIDSWSPMWTGLAAHRRVTAMDRRGRGSSGDADGYTLDREFADIAAVAELLATEQGGPVDAVGHSIGATCVLGAAALGAPFRRIALYEPPGPPTVANGFPARIAAMIAVDRPVLLLLGTAGPPWAGEIVTELAVNLPTSTVVRLAGIGHEGLWTAPDRVLAEIAAFLDD